MKGFALDASGDVLVEGGEISMVVGDSLLQQTVWSVLRTNLNEWFFDLNQGIDMSNLLGRQTSEELVRYVIERGLRQVDETFAIAEFSYTADRQVRKSTVAFTAQTAGGARVGGDYTWA